MPLRFSFPLLVAFQWAIVCIQPLRAGGFAGSGPSINGTVRSVPEAEDGRILVVGAFTAVNEVGIRRVARLFADGATDRSFDAAADEEVFQIFPRAGGGLVGLGKFSRIGGAPAPYLAALLENGRLDSSISYSLQSLPAAGLMQSDGKVVVGGNVLKVDGKDRGPLVRFLPEGLLDPGFSANITGGVSGMQILLNGTLMVWGSFSAVDGVPRARIARLLSDGRLDPVFVSPVFAGLSNAVQLQVVEQPDGRLLIGGAFSAVNGSSARGMVRLLANGDRDPEFSANFSAGTGGGTIRSIALQQDGMILAGGNFTHVNGVAANHAVRLSRNGTPDSAWTPQLNGAVHSIAIQESGGIVMGGEFTAAGAGIRNHIYGEAMATQSMLAIEGGSRITWNRSGQLAALEKVRFEAYSEGESRWMDLGAAVAIEGGWQLSGVTFPDPGTIRARGAVAGSPGTYRTARLGIGEVRPKLRIESMPGQALPEAGGSVEFDALPSTPGNVVRHREITLMNPGSGVLRVSAATLSGPQSGDFSLQGFSPAELAPGETANFLIGFKPTGSGIRTASLRLTSNAEGSPQEVLLRGEGTAGMVSAVFRHADELPLLVESWPHGLELGPLELGFHPAPGTVLRVVDNRSQTSQSSWFRGIQPMCFLTAEYGGVSYQFQIIYTGGSTATLGNDISLVLAGPGTLRRRIPQSTALASLPDGRLVMEMTDLGAAPSLLFTTPTGLKEREFLDAGRSISSIVVRGDGKLMVVEKTPDFSQRIRVLQPDGAPDPDFPAFLMPNTLQPELMAVGPDGSIFISSLHPDATGRGLLRLAPQATVPVPFGPALENSLTRGGIGALAVQSDGKVLVGSRLASGLGVPMVRLKPDGVIDSGFKASLPFGGSFGVTRILVQPDGRILICGEFAESSGISLLCLQRLLPNGDLDPSFVPRLPSGLQSYRDVTSMALQADGRIIIGGNFTQVGGRSRNRLARLFPDGSLDPTFTPDVNQIVQTVSLTPSGEVAIAGEFSILNSTSAGRGALLENDPPVSILKVETEGGASKIRWMRGGSLPEADQVIFEASTALMAGWRSLGSAARVPGGWELDALTLEPRGRIRARARYSSGYGGGSSGLQETVCSYPEEQTVQQRWREDFFGFAGNAGDAADYADPDADGYPNYLEFALGSDPTSPLPAALPEWQRYPLYSIFALDFTARAGTGNFMFTGEWVSDQRLSTAWNQSRNLGRRPDWTFREELFTRSTQFGRLRIVPPAKNP